MLPLQMPLAAITAENRENPENSQPGPSPETLRLTRGVCRLFADEGLGPLTEFRLPNRRRVDVIGLDAGGEFRIVEVKISVADFRADLKWPDYLPYCDQFYFAVPADFPHDIVPEEYGLIVADGFGAVVRREAPEHKMSTVRRRRQQMRFALTASERLHRMTDPNV